MTQLFQNISVCLWGQSSERNIELRNLILENGGQVSSTLENNTTHFVLTENEVGDAPLQQAEEAKIFVVVEEFFRHSVHQGQRLDEKDFLLDTQGQNSFVALEGEDDPTNQQRHSYEEDEEEGEEDNDELDFEEEEEEEEGIAQEYSIHSQLAGQNLSNYVVNLPELSVFFTENETPSTFDEEGRLWLGQISHLDSNQNDHYEFGPLTTNDENLAASFNSLPPVLQRLVDPERKFRDLIKLKEVLELNPEVQDEPLGITRVKILEIVVLLIGYNYHRVDMELIEQGILAPCIALFFRYTTSNVLHCLFQRLAELILINSECNELKHHFLVDCNFAEALALKFTEAEETIARLNGATTETASSSPSSNSSNPEENHDVSTVTAVLNKSNFLFVEHLKNIANLIIVCTESHENIARILSQNTTWASFVETRLKQANQREIDIKKAFPEVPIIEHPPVFNFFF